MTIRDQWPFEVERGPGPTGLRMGHTWRLLCSLVLVMACFLLRDLYYNIRPILHKKELHRSPDGPQCKCNPAAVWAASFSAKGAIVLGIGRSS